MKKTTKKTAAKKKPAGLEARLTKLVDDLETQGSRLLSMYGRVLDVIEHKLGADYHKASLRVIELAGERDHLQHLLDLARRPLIEHEPGEGCILELEAGETEPTCWICKLRDETDPAKPTPIHTALDWVVAMTQRNDEDDAVDDAILSEWAGRPAYPRRSPGAVRQQWARLVVALLNRMVRGQHPARPARGCEHLEAEMLNAAGLARLEYESAAAPTTTEDL